MRVTGIAEAEGVGGLAVHGRTKLPVDLSTSVGNRDAGIAGVWWHEDAAVLCGEMLGYLFGRGFGILHPIFSLPDDLCSLPSVQL